MRIEHELTIPAPIDEVWEMTIDVESWPTMTPTMTSVRRLDDGPFGVGSQARIEQPKQRPRIWTVTRFEAPHRFEWQATLGTVTMTGGHELTSLDDDPAGAATRNRLTLDLTGFGSGLLARLAGRQLAAAIATENEGFRAKMAP